MPASVKIILLDNAIKCDFHRQKAEESYNAVIDFCMDKGLSFRNDESAVDIYSIYVYNPTYEILKELKYEIPDDYTIS